MKTFSLHVKNWFIFQSIFKIKPDLTPDEGGKSKTKQNNSVLNREWKPTKSKMLNTWGLMRCLLKPLKGCTLCRGVLLCVPQAPCPWLCWWPLAWADTAATGRQRQQQPKPRRFNPDWAAGVGAGTQPSQCWWIFAVGDNMLQQPETSWKKTLAKLSCPGEQTCPVQLPSAIQST